MVVQFISKDDAASPTTNGGAGTTTLVVNRGVPTTTQFHDLILAFVTKGANANQTITPPSGWTLINSVEANDLNITAYYKIDLGAEPNSYTWTISSATRQWNVLHAVYRGVDVDYPIIGSSTGTDTTTASPLFPTVDVLWDGCGIVQARASRRNTTTTNVAFTSGTPDPGTKIQELGTFDANSPQIQRRSASWFTTVATAGIKGGGQTTASVSITDSMLMTVALKPILSDPEPSGYTYFPIEHVGSQGGFNTANTATAVVTKPVGLAVGDFMLAFLNDSTNGINTPAGWTAYDSDDATGGTVYRSAVMYKVADSSDVAAANFTFTSSNGNASPFWASISAYRYVDTSSPIHAVNMSYAQDTTTSVTGPTVTTTIPTLLVHHRCSRRVSATISTYTSDFNIERIDGGNHGASTMYSGATYDYGFLSAAGSNGGATIVVSGAPTDHFSRTIALTPIRSEPARVRPSTQSVVRSSRW